jgi:chorismate dehydratase
MMKKPSTDERVPSPSRGQFAIRNPQSKIPLGCVSYLNARPLIFGAEAIARFTVPSVLADELHRGRLDAALIPIAEHLAHRGYRLVPNIAIACRGPAQSVYLAHTGPFRSIRTVSLDPSSRTSNLLCRVILSEFYSLAPRYVVGSRRPIQAMIGRSWLQNLWLRSPDRGRTRGTADRAHVFIGDPALRLRGELRRHGFHLLDLGQAWRKHTGLPFVFAVWALRKGVSAAPWTRFLTQLKNQGLRNIHRIVATQDVLPAAAARTYLSKIMRYDLGSSEIRGIREFQRLATKHHLIP